MRRLMLTLGPGILFASTAVGALMLIIGFPKDIRTLLDFDNILSFCVAPPSALAPFFGHPELFSP